MSALKSPRRPLTAAELADLRGVDPRTVRRWARAGCPVAKRGKRGHAAPLFDAEAVAAWLAQAEGEERELVASLCRRLDALSRKAARELAVLEASHVTLEDVDRVWSEIAAEIRKAVAKHYGRPLAERIASLKDEVAVAAELKAAAHATLEELAGPAAAYVEEPELRPRPIRRSRTLREARSQLAGLQGEVLDVKDAIARGTAEWARRRQRRRS